MTDRPHSVTGSSVVPRSRRAWIGWLGIVQLCLPLVAGGDAYLDAIEQAASQLAGGDAEEAAQAGSASQEPQAAFERELERRYRGSYQFYKKLPAKSREEVFLDYKGGASIEEVRKTIMNRFLHSR